MPQLPINEGCHPSVAVTEEGKMRPARLKFPEGSTFGDLCKEYTFFTYAPVILYGGLNFDPMLQFYNEHPDADRPAVIFTDEPIFAGLETHNDVTFNHMLIAVRKHVWPDLSQHLGTIGMRNDEQKLYIETAVQKLPMADFLELRREIVHVTVPMVDIYGVALDGNQFCLHFHPAVNPPVDKIKLIKSPPRQQTVEFAEGLFQGKPELKRIKDR